MEGKKGGKQKGIDLNERRGKENREGKAQMKKKGLKRLQDRRGG